MLGTRKARAAKLKPALRPQKSATSGGTAAAARGPALTERAAKGSFSRIMQSKLDSADHSLEKMRKALESALARLSAAGMGEASSIEKTIREILEDSRLTPRQKAARMKSLLEQVQERAAQAHPAEIALKAQTARSAESSRGEREAAAAPAIAEKGQRKTAEVRLSIVDLRKSQAEKGGADSQAARQGGASVPAAEKPASGAFPAPASAAELRQGSPSAHGGGAPRSLTLQTPLERLREMAGSELARSAGIILRNGGGEIRLVLKPESLGSVRVRLNLSDNVIDGKIIVDNPAVKHVLEGSLDSLTRALSAEGFQTASLSVSVGGGGADSRREERDAPAVRRIESARGFTGALADVLEPADWGELLVNLFA
jgi:flagellar hook-length control protein FliK